MTATPASASAFSQTAFSSLQSRPGSVTSSKHVRGRMRAVVLECRATLAPRLAGRNAQIDQRAAAEQRPVARRVVQFDPVETGDCGEHFAFVETLAAGRCTNGIGRFDDQQGFVAVDDVDRLQLTFKMRCKLLALELHCRPTPQTPEIRLGRRQTTHQLLYQIVLHISPEQILFLCLGQHVRVGISQIAGQFDHAGQYQIAALAIDNAVAIAITQPFFTYATGTGEREDDRQFLLERRQENRLRVRSAIGKTGRSRGPDGALQAGIDQRIVCGTER